MQICFLFKILLDTLLQKKMASVTTGHFLWSGRQDLNLRPRGPKPRALPDCATPRLLGSLRNVFRGEKEELREALADFWPLDCQKFGKAGVCSNVVGVTGFEPATSASRTLRATKLRHTPVLKSDRTGVIIAEEQRKSKVRLAF